MKKLILLSPILAIVGLVVLQISMNAEEHVVVVEDNVTLVEKNGDLEATNKKLEKDNKILKTQVDTLSKKVSSLEKANQKVVKPLLGTTKKQLKNEKVNPDPALNGSKFEFKPIELPDSDDNQ